VTTPARIQLTLDDVPVVPARCRLQWEAAQQGYVILYPEGMVKLSASAAEIVRRVDGRASIADILDSLEQAFPGGNLRDDVLEFLNAGYERGWIEAQGR
jgi:pyrroloquinoline quinone biosynthesis protein D